MTSEMTGMIRYRYYRKKQDRHRHFRPLQYIDEAFSSLYKQDYFDNIKISQSLFLSQIRD